MELVLDRWVHILAGTTWIGLLYYFDFVQAPALARARDDNTAAGITRHVTPLALLWYRYAALVTWVTGAYFLERYGYGLRNTFSLHGSAAYIGIGAWLGTIMLFNVWVLIWPNQKKILGLVHADEGEQFRAARIALLASRTNTMLSIPMVFFMVVGTAAHRGLIFS